MWKQPNATLKDGVIYEGGVGRILTVRCRNALHYLVTAGFVLSSSSHWQDLVPNSTVQKLRERVPYHP